MHAGNIFVKNNGDIALVDFGLVCEIEMKDRRAVATMIYAFLRQDYELALKTQLKAGYIDERVFYDCGYRLAMRNLAMGFSGRFDMSVFTQELFKAMNDYNVFVPKHLLMLNKTILYVEGITKQLDDKFEALRVISPWIGKWYKQQRVLMFFEAIFHKTKA
jgi:ubiquinone biosynthesis protein